MMLAGAGWRAGWGWDLGGCALFGAQFLLLGALSLDETCCYGIVHWRAGMEHRQEKSVALLCKRRKVNQYMQSCSMCV